MTADNLVELDNVTRVYGSPPVRALDGINLTISRGEILAIIGPSGSGKSTLMNVLGTLDQPTSGQVTIDGVDTRRLSDPQLSSFRSHLIGFVFQQFHLSDGVSALENVADGLLYSGIRRKERNSRAGKVLERVGLGQRTQHHPNQMSGGERQRVAIARALIGDPLLLLADEPTGNLDSASGEAVIELLRELNGTGTTIVIITHDRDLAARLPRNVSVKDGRITSDVSHA